MAAEVRHVSFNPMVLSAAGYPTVLQHICAREEKEGWKLFRVIAVHQFETIAVFTREAPDAPD